MYSNNTDLSYDYIESSIILNTHNRQDLRIHSSLKSSDFSVHGDAYDFLLDFFKTYKVAPNFDTLIGKFEGLAQESLGENLEFSIATFNKQCLTRKALSLLTTQSKLMKENPKKAVLDIISGLSNLNLNYDNDIYLYDNGSVDRLNDFKERQNIRNNNALKIIGIPTPLRSVNNLGLGLLPGEICSLIARPGVGKSWFALKAAAISSSLNYKTLLISTEMPAEQMSLRLDVILGRIRGYKFSHQALKLGKDNLDTNAYEKYLLENNKNNIIIVDSIKDSIDLLVHRHEPSVLVIDNAELMVLGSGSYNRMWEKNYDLYYGLKNLCTSNKIAAFVTHQANREAIDPYKPPGRHEISSGDALLRASDMVLSMCLVRDNDKQRMIGFQKFRDLEEPLDYVLCEFDVDAGIFQEI